jgi:hypothetical protein
MSIAEPAPAFTAVHQRFTGIALAKTPECAICVQSIFQARGNSGMEMRNGSENLRSTRSAWLASVNPLVR